MCIRGILCSKPQDYNEQLNTLVNKLSRNTEKSRYFFRFYQVYRDSKIIKKIIDISNAHLNELKKETIINNQCSFERLLILNGFNKKLHVRMLTSEEEIYISYIRNKLKTQLKNIEIREVKEVQQGIDTSKPVILEKVQQPIGLKNGVSSKILTPPKNLIPPPKNLIPPPKNLIPPPKNLPFPLNGSSAPQTLTRKCFEGECLKLLPFDWKKNFSKDVNVRLLVKELADGLENALKPIKIALERHKELKKETKNLKAELDEAMKKLDDSKTKLELAANSEDFIFLRKEIKNKPDQRFPLFSDEAFEEINAIKKQFQKAPLTDHFKKSELAICMNKIIPQLKENVLLAQQKFQVADLKLKEFEENNTNNGIPFSDFKTLFKDKTRILQEFQHRLTRFKPTDEVITKPEIVKDAEIAKAVDESKSERSEYDKLVESHNCLKIANSLNQDELLSITVQKNDIEGFFSSISA